MPWREAGSPVATVVQNAATSRSPFTNRAPPAPIVAEKPAGRAREVAVGPAVDADEDDAPRVRLDDERPRVERPAPKRPRGRAPGERQEERREADETEPAPRREDGAPRGHDDGDRDAARRADSDENRHGDDEEDAERRERPRRPESRQRREHRPDPCQGAERRGDLGRHPLGVAAAPEPQGGRRHEERDEDGRHDERAEREPEEEDERVAERERRRRRVERRLRERHREGEEERPDGRAEEEALRLRPGRESALEDRPLDAAVEVAPLAQALTGGLERERLGGALVGHPADVSSFRQRVRSRRTRANSRSISPFFPKTPIASTA